MLLLLYILLILNLLLNSYSTKIRSEIELIKLLSSKNEKELYLEIENEITVFQDISFLESVEKITITGNQDKPIINMGDYGQMKFNSTVNEIILENVSIIGNIIFNDIKKININGVKFSGFITSSFNKVTNEYTKLNQVEFTTNKNSDNECLNLSGNLQILFSKFTGSSYCKHNLLNYDGLNEYNLEIKDSYFNGNYQCSCLKITNGKKVDISKSEFLNGYSPVNTKGGAAINIEKTSASIKNCVFRNNYSENAGGTFYLNNNDDFIADSIEIYNTTSFSNGAMAYVYSSKNNTSIFSKFTHFDSKEISKIESSASTSGLIIAASGSALVNVDDYYIDGVVYTNASGSLFLITQNGSINVRNFKGNNIIGGGSSDGLLLNSYDVKQGTFNAYNYTLTNIKQKGNKASAALLWLEENTDVVLEKGKVINFKGYNSHLIYLSDHTNLQVNDLEVDNFESEKSISLIHISIIRTVFEMQAVFDQLKLNNIISQGSLFKATTGQFVIRNSIIKNVHLCYKTGTCKGSVERNEADIVNVGDGSMVTVQNTIFDNIYGDFGLNIKGEGVFSSISNTFSNSYFKKGLLYVDPNDYDVIYGGHQFHYTNFINIEAENGPVGHFLNIPSDVTYMIIPGYIDVPLYRITYSNCLFKNNHARKFGGVFYTESENIKGLVSVEYCTFENNTALSGDAFFTNGKDYMPNILGLDPSRIEKLSGSNPSKLRLVENKNRINLTNIEIYSGESILDGLSYSVFDDYNKLITFGNSISNINFEDFMFFSIEVDDISNAEILGQSSYCWNKTCKIPPVKLYGNPGIYSVSLAIKTYGKFKNFKNNRASIPIKIKPCNKYLNQISESRFFKSCYDPVCNPACSNNGKCVNNNFCSCENSTFTGALCDEYYKLERSDLMDKTLRSLSVFLIIIVFILIFLIYKNRNEPLIKGGSIDFLIIILFGSIINLSYIYFITAERTVERCYSQYLLNNIGFALVFGSILVKTLRIYKIFRGTKKQNMGIKKITMYAIVLGIVAYHLAMATLWTLQRSIKIKPYISNNKEYYNCVFPTTKNLCIVLNFSILFIGAILSYSIRYVKENFKENLVIPIYVYVLFTILTEIINSQTNITIMVQDLFSGLGTIFTTSVILIYLYIIKLYSVYMDKSNEQKYGSKIYKDNNMFLNKDSSFGDDHFMKFNYYELKNNNSFSSISKHSRTGSIPYIFHSNNSSANNLAASSTMNRSTSNPHLNHSMSNSSFGTTPLLNRANSKNLG